MTLAAALAAVILDWLAPCPPKASSENRPDYRTRVGIISEAVADAVRGVPWRFGRRGMAAAVLVIFDRESRFDRAVHAGERRGDRGKANCMGSVHASPLAPDWAELGGVELEPTIRCARAVARNLRSKAWECLNAPPGFPGTMAGMAYVFEGYARGHCAPPGPESVARAVSWARVVGAL